MKSRSPVIVVGLDAFDPKIARGLAAANYLPNLRRLFDSAAISTVRNPYGLFVGALWMTFSTGQGPERHGFHSWDEVEIASYARRLTRPPDMQRPFWKTLSDAGCHVAVIDVPHSKAEPLTNGVQLVEWGCHDRHFGFHTWPPGKAAEIDTRFGLHPVLGLNAYAEQEFAADDYTHRAGLYRTCDEDRALLAGLIGGLRAKRDIASAIFAEKSPDLRLVVMGESHAVGHQQWHLHDQTHPRFDANARIALGCDPLLKIYSELDASLGEVLAHADDATTILVLLSHGMGPHYDGVHLLDEVLTRIDRFDRQDHGSRGPRQRLKTAVAGFPGQLQRQVMAFAVPVIRGRESNSSLSPAAEFASPEQRAKQRFFLEPNNSVFGGVRLNLVGREPQGCVEPADFDRVCRRLKEDLLSLVNVKTGRAVVHAVERADRWYTRSNDDTIPDLFIDWNRTDPIETVWSLKTGVVHAPYTNWRTGDHRMNGMLLACGPGIPSRTTMPVIDLADLAPSICARFGVAMEDVDGRIIPWLARGS